jgi:ribosomal protein S2
MKNFREDLEVFFVKKYITHKLFVGDHANLCKSSVRPFVKGFRNKFSIIDIDLSILYFRKAIKFLLKVILSKKKILFIGAPLGFEKEFRKLCLSCNHYIIEDEYFGFFSNYRNLLQVYNKSILHEKPSLIFIFSLPSDTSMYEEFSKLDVPIMGFISRDGDIRLGIDYLLPANIKNVKGSLFAYNFFFSLLTF